MRKIKTYSYELDEFLTLCETDPPDDGHDNDSIEGSLEFTGTKTYEDAMNNAREGTELESVQQTAEYIKTGAAAGTITDTVHSVAGSFVDVGMFVTGEPECMVDFSETDAKKFISILVNTCESARVNSEHIQRKAGVIVALIDSLESKDYRVSIDIIVPTELGNYNKNTCTCIRIKDFKEPLFLGRLSGCLHVGFFRRLWFRWIELTYPRNRGTYGCPIEIEDNQIEEVRQTLNLEDRYLFIPSLTHGKYTYGDDQEAELSYHKLRESIQAMDDDDE